MFIDILSAVCMVPLGQPRAWDYIVANLYTIAVTIFSDPGAWHSGFTDICCRDNFDIAFG